MSNITVTIDNGGFADKKHSVVLGDTITVNVGSGFTESTRFTIKMRCSQETYILGSEMQTGRSGSITVPISLVNTLLLNQRSKYWSLEVWGYRYYSGLKEWDKSGEWGIHDLYTLIPMDTYHPTLTLGNLVCADTKKYNNGVLLAGISTVKCSVSVGHNVSTDQTSLNDPQGFLDTNNSRVIASYDGESKTLYYEYPLPTSTQNYTTRMLGYVSDGRAMFQDGSEFTIMSPQPSHYVFSNDVTVYSYAYPTYNFSKTYVNRCDASGNADGMGNYVRIHIEYEISKVDGNNKFVSISTQVNGTAYTPINSNYATIGYAEYIISLSTSQSATVEITMVDSVCQALETSSYITSLSIPKATIPFSLFDDGTDKGTAFGQMATKVGNWFYGNLIFVRNNVPYLLDVTDTGSITSRQLIGNTGTRTFRVQFKIVSSTGDVDASVYKNADIAREADAFLHDYEYIDQQGQRFPPVLSAEFDVPCGTVVHAIANGGWESQYFGAFLNGTTELPSKYLPDSGAYDFYATINSDSYFYIYAGPSTPSFSDPRLKVTVSSNGSDYYSFWDEDRVNYKANGNLILYTVSGNKVKLNQQCADGKKFVNWSLGSSTYTESYMKNTGVKITGNTSIVANYREAQPEVALTVTGFTSGYRMSYFYIKNKSTNEYVYTLSWGDSGHEDVAISLEKNFTYTIGFEQWDALAVSITINGTTYIGYNEGFAMASVEADYTITGDTTIILG